MCKNNCKANKDLTDEQVEDMMKLIALENKSKVLETALELKEYFKEKNLRALALEQAGKLNNGSRTELLSAADVIYEWLQK